MSKMKPREVVVTRFLNEGCANKIKDMDINVMKVIKEYSERVAIAHAIDKNKLPTVDLVATLIVMGYLMKVHVDKYELECILQEEE